MPDRASIPRKDQGRLAAGSRPGTTTAIEQADVKVLFRRLLALAWRYKAGCIAVLALSAIEISLTVAGLRTLGLGIDYLRSLGGGTEVSWPLGLQPPADWSVMAVITSIALVVLAIALLATGIRFAAAVLAAYIMQNRLVVDLRTRVFDKLQRLSFRFFDANETGSIIQRVTSDVQGTREFVEVVVLQTVIVLLTLIVYLVFMLQIHVGLTVACLATVPVMWWLAIRFSRRVRPAYRESRELMDGLVKHLVETVQGVHVVKGFAIEDDRVKGFTAQNREVQQQHFGIFDVVSRFVPSVHFLMELNMGVLLGYGGYLVIVGQFPLGAGLIVFAGLLREFAMQVNNIANITNSVQNSLTGSARVFEILDAPIEVEDRQDATALRAVQGALSFEGVSFGYRDGDRILEQIDLQVAPGQCVAILGATGAGKSSLLSLIPRFYDPAEGRVLLDGRDLRDCPLDELRKQVGVVFQESFLFSTTVAANIAFGNPDASREQIETAARIACAHEFVSQLGQGYDTVIGERGTNLSGGQRQRLAIARAILADPRILLLDDATAAIDPETEEEIMTAMERAMEGRTTFIVAHRLSTLRRADLVVVLEHGRISQVGTHEELMHAGGRYRDAAELQQANDESRRLLRIAEQKRRA